MKEIDTIFKNEVDEQNTPSGQYIIFDKDSVIHRFQFGLADINMRMKGILTMLTNMRSMKSQPPDNRS